MSTKPRRFPLSLDALAGKSAPGSRAKAPADMARPQTAMRNALRGGAPMQTQEKIAIGAAARPLASSPAMASAAVRKAMVARIAQQGIGDVTVLAAMEAVPRHQFLEQALASQAYIDASLPIGHQQTISQPYIVARMIEILRQNTKGGALERVLEIGTGCGYQAAVLARLAKEVFSVERIKSLHELAKANLRPLRIPNIRLHHGDGMLGFPQAAPFDGIILAAAGLEVPQALLEQMTIGGRLIAPVGTRTQSLSLIERKGRHEWISSELESCHFVPLRPGTVT
jgi:protein-L-isoaspartate(D-aspartate) O-methyltransferase